MAGSEAEGSTKEDKGLRVGTESGLGMEGELVIEEEFRIKGGFEIKGRLGVEAGFGTEAGEGTKAAKETTLEEGVIESGFADRGTEGQSEIRAGEIEAETDPKGGSEGMGGASKGAGMLGWVWGGFFIFPSDVYFGDGMFFLRTDE